VKKTLLKLLQPLLSKCGLQLQRTSDYDRQHEREQLLEQVINVPVRHSAPLQLQFIVFSKDRALQLHGLLSSLLQNVTGNFTLHVLYHASSEEHQKAYNEVRHLFSKKTDWQWTKENNFRANLIQILENSHSTEICFLVDDIVFIRPINLDTIDWDTYSKGILSLRLGKGITFCYTKQKSMAVPPLKVVNTNDKMLQFQWGASDYDWAYPLSVDGHIFPTHEIQVAVKELNYSAPNSFERALQRLSPLYSKRPGYCFASPRLLNIPLNRVQDEVDNCSGDICPEKLLARWNEGLTLHWRELSNIKTESVHKEVPVKFSPRQTSL